MPSALEDRSVIAPDEAHRDQYEQLSKALHGLTPAVLHHAARLVGPDGTSVELPEDVYNLLRQVVDDITAGRAVMLKTTDPVLTTGEAAEILGISRVTLVKLLDEGEIPHHMRGRHRRVHLADVLAYDQRVRRERRKILHQMSYEAAASGMDRATDVLPVDED